MNNCQFVGRLTADPELRRTQEGTAVCSYSLAVKRPMTKDVTDFLDFVTWRQGAEYLTQYSHKGDIVAVSGALQARDWTDRNGNKRRAFEIATTSVELLSSKRNSQDTRALIPERRKTPDMGSPAPHSRRTGGTDTASRALEDIRISPKMTPPYRSKPEKSIFPQKD